MEERNDESQAEIPPWRVGRAVELAVARVGIFRQENGVKETGPLKDNVGRTIGSFLADTETGEIQCTITDKTYLESFHKTFINNVSIATNHTII